jgi:hypothetical protein
VGSGKEKAMGESRHALLQGLGALVGEWATEATHPAYPSSVVHGHSAFEFLEGKKFLILRARSDHPDFPDSISIIGDTEGLRMHYFDSRGVHRLYEVSVSEDAWELSHDAPGFSQRFTGQFEEAGDRISGCGNCRAIPRTGKTTWKSPIGEPPRTKFGSQR